MEKITGIILAGGKSSRMGRDKGLLKVKGIAMVEHIINRLKSFCQEVIIISDNEEYKSFGVPVHEDLVKDKGPIGGIFTGLMNSTTEMNLVLSCDVPNVPDKLLKHLMAKSNDFDVTMPEFLGRRHPMMAVYRKSSTDKFKTHVDENKLKLTDLCEELKHTILKMDNELEFNDPKFYTNINTPEDLAKIQA